MATVIILTSGSSWTVPADYNRAGSTIELIGGGGGGGAGSPGSPAQGRGGGGAGGGGAYTVLGAWDAPAAGTDVPFTIGTAGSGGVGSAGGAGTSTTFSTGDAGGVAAAGLGGAINSAGGAGGAGGLASSCTPPTPATSGGTGGAGAAGSGGVGGGAGGGGGAAGPDGAGIVGGAGLAGIGGVGGAGDASSGGAGGVAGGPGANGTEWTTAGSGGGGGGGHGGDASVPRIGLPGGLGGYCGAGGGGGGGGAGGSGAAGSGTAGNGGVIVITYSPFVPCQETNSEGIPLCDRKYDESSGCWRYDQWCKPTACIDVEIGECPEQPLGEDSSGLIVCPGEPSCYRGIRDHPRLWYCQARAGFTIGRIVQYFWADPAYEPILVHSHLAWTFESTGQFKYVELDNFKIPRHILWDRDDPKDQESELQASGSCPVPRDLPGTMSGESSGGRKTRGCYIRFMALRGLYGCVQPSSNGGISSNPAPLSEESLFKVLFNQETLTCTFDNSEQNIIEMIDPTMSNVASEMGLEVDSAGKVCRVYGGGRFKCDVNPILWDRDDPPPNQPGFVIPFMQSSVRWGLDDSGSFDIWVAHFDSTGCYIYTCLYMRICMCQPSCTREDCGESDIPPQPYCVCFNVCLVTQGCGGLAENNVTCPGTLSVDCGLALTPECADDVVEPGDCVYPWQLGCCPIAPPTPPGMLMIDGADAGSVGNQGCLYMGTAATKTCVLGAESHPEH